MLPAAVMGIIHWAAGSWWRIAGLVALTYVIYEVAERSGAMAWFRTLFRAGTTVAWLINQVVEFGVEINRTFHTFVDDFNEVMGTDLSAMGWIWALMGVWTAVSLIALY